MDPIRQLLAVEPTAAAGSADPAAPRDWLSVYTHLLTLEGYSPVPAGEHQLNIRHHGWNIALANNPRDAEFFQLVLPNFWDLSSEEAYARAALAADQINRRFPVVKVHSGEGRSMRVSIEMFIADPAHAAPVLRRCLDALSHAAHLFEAAMLLSKP